MGLTSEKVRISNPALPERRVELDMLLDSGALYSVVPGRLLRELRIRPHATETFELADGRRIRRQIGTAFFEIGTRQGASTVIFGRLADSCLLGALALESMGLVLDLSRQRLRPMRPIRL
jgi:predicted aspartyl protease